MNHRLLEVTRKIDEKDIVSFDIFDTLLLRNVYKPTDIFRILAAKVQKNWGIEDFAEMRIDAEKTARTRVKNQEVNLNEIYDELRRSCELPCEEIKKLELDLEYEFIKANPFIKEVYEYAKEKRKRIFFISDMYLSKQFIGKLLKKCGYEAEDIFLSNEYRENKGQMKLYEIVQKTYNLSKLRWIHIGDNYISDYEKALEFGIEAYHYKNVSTYNQGMEIKTIGESIIAGIRNNFLYNGQELKYWEEFGAKYVSPIYFGFTKWLYELTKKEDNLYFLARDGYAIKKIYEKFCEADNNPIYTEYLYCSRITLQLPALAKLPTMDRAVKELTVRGGFPWSERLALKEMLAKAQVTDWKRAEEIMNAFGFVSLDEELTEEKIYMAQKMVARLGDHIKNNILSKQELCLKYLKQEKITEWTQVNVMDIGWQGSCQNAIEKLVGKKVTGYYMGTSEPKTQAGKDTFCTMFGWYFDNGIPVCNYDKYAEYVKMYEFLFSAPHGMTVGYEEIEDGTIIPVLSKNESCNHAVKEFQKTALELCEAYQKYMPYIGVLRPEFCMDAYDTFLDRKDVRDLEMFRDLENDYILGDTDKFPYVAVLTSEDVENDGRKNLKKKLEKTLWKNAFLVEGDICVDRKSVFLCNSSKDIYEAGLNNGLGYAKIYYDYGSGFNEHDSVIIKMVREEDKYSFKLNYSFDVKAIRIDPIECHFIKVRNYSLEINGKLQKIIIPNLGKAEADGYRIIETNDPQLIAEMIDEKVMELLFEAEMKLVE